MAHQLTHFLQYGPHVLNGSKRSDFVNSAEAARCPNPLSHGRIPSARSEKSGYLLRSPSMGEHEPDSTKTWALDDPESFAGTTIA